MEEGSIPQEDRIIGINKEKQTAIEETVPEKVKKEEVHKMEEGSSISISIGTKTNSFEVLQGMEAIEKEEGGEAEISMKNTTVEDTHKEDRKRGNKPKAQVCKQGKGNQAREEVNLILLHE